VVGFFVNTHLELNYGEDTNFVGNDILHPVNTAMVIARILATTLSAQNRPLR
jgi:hypothetical protein